MLKRVPVYLQAQEAIKSYIEQHGLGPGDSLPSEAALARELGSSRASLREGIKSLEALGIVEVRHGEGIFVKAFSFDAIFNNLPYSFVADGRSLHELTQVRAALEEGLVRMVVSRADAAYLERLRQLTARMQLRAAEGQAFEEEDRQFHAELYRPLGNLFVLRLVELFWEVFNRLNKANPTTIERTNLLRSAQEHQAIVAALEQGDPQQASEAMRSHFADIRRRVERGLQSRPPELEEQGG